MGNFLTQNEDLIRDQRNQSLVAAFGSDTDFIKRYEKVHDEVLSMKHIRKDIMWWTYKGDRLISKCLRSNDCHMADKIAASNIITAINMMIPTEKEISLYRGVRPEKELKSKDGLGALKEQSYFKDGYLKDSGFVALTSSYKDAVYKFINWSANCCIMKVTIPKGSKILAIPNIFGKNDNEQEFLIFPGSKIKLEKNERSIDKTIDFVKSKLVGFDFDAVKKYAKYNKVTLSNANQLSQLVSEPWKSINLIIDGIKVLIEASTNSKMVFQRRYYDIKEIHETIPQEDDEKSDRIIKISIKGYEQLETNDEGLYFSIMEFLYLGHKVNIKLSSRDFVSEGKVDQTELDCHDFLECAKKGVVDGYDVLTIPKGTILYHGTSISFPDGSLPNSPAYFADLLSSHGYAFKSDFRKGVDGKIISFKVTKPIVLINITKKSLDLLSKREVFDKEIFEYAFNYGNGELERVSHASYDTQITDWFCKQGLFDGWTQHLPQFHPEMLLCNTDALVRYDIEYRFDPYYYDNLFKMKNNKISKILKSDSLGKISFSTRSSMFKEAIEKYGDMYLLPLKNNSDKHFVDEVRKADKAGLVKSPF